MDPASPPAPARFYDGVTAQAVPVGAKWGIGELLIYRPQDYAIVARWRLEDMVLVGDSEHEAMPAVGLKGSEARLIVEDAALRAELGRVGYLAPLVAPKPAVPPRLAKFGGALVVLVGLFYLAVDYGSPFAARFVPFALQARLGEAVFESVAGEKDICTGEDGNTALNDLANRLARAGGLEREVSVTVLEGKPVNAFTLPGNQIVIFSDLIKQAADGEEVAGVLAHEIGHAIHEHPIQGMARHFGINLLLGLLTGGYSEMSTLGSGGTLLLALRNGRGFEREADATGLRLLEKNGLRADGMARFFERMMKEDPSDQAKAMGIWSDHPPTAERIAATRRSAVGRPAFTPAEWKAIRSICKD